MTILFHSRSGRYFSFAYLPAVLLFILALEIGTPEFAAAGDGENKTVLQRPSWLGSEPLIIVGNWDSMPLFRRRVGGNPLWQEEEYAKEHSEDAVRKLKEMGVTMAVIHFYKGFGLAAEREHMEDAKKLAQLCRKYGIRVGVYIGSTLAHETFLLEKPEAKEWIIDDYIGQPVRYGSQTFRKRVYFMHPGYIEYMKNVVRIAIQDFGVDLIHFDNTSMQAQPPIFFHPLAVLDFRKYLNTKYTAAERKKRFGFGDISLVEPPPYARPLSTIDDPLFQEWADFRSQQLADYYGEMERYIRTMNPEVAVENNPHSGMSGNNTVWDQGVDYPRLLSHTDIVWTEEGNEAGVSDDGILISKIRTYKMAQTLKNRIFTYTSDSKLQMAEAMAYNSQCMGMVGGALAGYELPEAQRAYVKFYHENFDYYRDIETVSDVAVLHSYASMAYNNDRPYQSTFLFEQALIEAKVPFDILFDENLDALSKYKVLVLADQECITERQAESIRRYVQRGGGLIATENTSLYNEWRQRRMDFALRDVFGAGVPAPSGRQNVATASASGPVQTMFGKGRVVYIPEVIPAIEKPAAAPMRSQYWKLPENAAQLIESVQWASGDNISIEVGASPYVTIEMVQKRDGSAVILHLLNYAVEKNHLERDIHVSLRLPMSRSAERVTVISPDGGAAQEIQFSSRNGSTEFSIPSLETYSLAIVHLKLKFVD